MILKLLFSHISDLSMILANAKTKVSINDTVIKAPTYVARFKGDLIAEPKAKGKFLGNLKLNISEDKKEVRRLFEDALAQKLQKTQKLYGDDPSSVNYNYRLAVGYDGRIRLNGTDLGPLIPEDTRFELTPPSTMRRIEMPTLPRAEVSREKDGIEERLRLLKSLFEKGLIQRDEYDKKRSEIIKAL